MMKKVLLLLLAVSILIITGCRGPMPAIQTEAAVDELLVSEAGIYSADKFRLFRQEPLVLARLEPRSGTYIGAYIRSERIIAGNIEAFEQMTGRSHSFYTYFLKLGQQFPSDWVLNCIALMKTPSIVIEPSNIADPFNRQLLRDTARSFGEIYVPMFVHFYPVSHNARYNADEYVAFFRAAQEYFTQYASNVAFVWVIDADSLHLMDTMYPGDEYVDWVGINLFVDSQMTIEDVKITLDTFYFHFHERKPIFISQLGISNFSTTDHAHRVAEASLMMEQIFEAIEQYYPRIKAVNYMSINSIDPARDRGGIYNFSIIDNEHITRAYTASIASPHFLSRTYFGAGGSEVMQSIAHPNAVRYYGGDFFVRSHMDIGSSRRSTDIAPDSIIDTGTLRYYPLAQAVGGNGAIRANFDSRIIEIVSFR